MSVARVVATLTVTLCLCWPAASLAGASDHRGHSGTIAKAHHRRKSRRRHHRHHPRRNEPHEPIQSPQKVKDAITIKQAYITEIDNPEFRGDAPYVEVVVKADDPHDSLLLYATSEQCASSVEAAEAIFEYETAGAMVIDAEIGGDTLSLSWSALGGYSYELKGYGRTDVQPGQYSTLCALLYDATGDPPQSLYPKGIARNHVWLSAQAPIGTGG